MCCRRPKNRPRHYDKFEEKICIGLLKGHIHCKMNYEILSFLPKNVQCLVEARLFKSLEKSLLTTSVQKFGILIDLISNYNIPLGWDYFCKLF